RSCDQRSMAMLVSSLPLSETMITGTAANCDRDVELARDRKLRGRISDERQRQTSSAREVIDDGADAEATAIRHRVRQEVQCRERCGRRRHLQHQPSSPGFPLSQDPYDLFSREPARLDVHHLSSVMDSNRRRLWSSGQNWLLRALERT